jgi:putative DNA primase/helicase
MSKNTEIIPNEAKKIFINEDQNRKFLGKKTHKETLEELLNQVAKINFIDYLGLKPEEGEKLQQKHYIVGVIKYLLEVANAEKLTLAKVHDFIYIYNGEYWKQIESDDFKNFLGEFAIKTGCKECDAIHFEFKDKLLKQFLSDSYLPQPQRNKETILINLSNNTFEFTGNVGFIRPFRAEDFLTYQLPFSYDSEAKCPMFDNYLQKVLPNENSRKVLQEFSGYIFTNLNLEKMLLLIGDGANGKSVFFNILISVLGRQNVLSYSMGLFNEAHNRAKLVDVLLNYSSEKGSDLKSDIFKAMVSGETIQACKKYGHPFEIHNKVSFIVNANEFPKEVEQTNAFFRRFLIVPFKVTIPESERDISLANKIIENELPGVFNWILIGMRRLVENKKFTDCVEVSEALDDFKKKSDSVALFIEEKGYKPSKYQQMTLAELYTLYKHFCYDDGYKPLGKKNFSERMEKRGFEKIRMSGGAMGFYIQVAIEEEDFAEMELSEEPPF